MIFPNGETVTLLTRVTTEVFDRYGKPTYTWLSTSIPGCGFDPGTSDESSLPHRQAVNTQPTLYMPAGTSIKATDRAVVRGLTYDVDGDPGEWVSPFTGWAPGIEVKLTKTEG